ncbi:alkaline shock response membrane anchor protein AmaP [Streptomyces oceani]|uniref:Alkaline shock response membrane anchor protein AmaP n=1 Tax=Streptomyces oceani TaxID=1075402 RepID=A0A1E7JZB8_9ACTN|nr:alkaline shock response membrane anchor protein AmaP [Streptomyces oceani]OEU96955.1 hypothetical protein AN216_17980 [Streptomyces oceani]
MLRIVNRVLLALLGLVFLTLGLGVLFGGLDLARRWGVDLSGISPWSGPHDVLLTEADRVRWRDREWWWPVVFVALGLLAALLLWWCAAQLRRRRLSEIVVDSGDGESALLRARAFERVLAAEAESLPGVDRARVVVRGRRTRPRAWVNLTLVAHAEPAVAAEELRTGALARARESAGLTELPAEVRLRCLRHRAERVS